LAACRSSDSNEHVEAVIALGLAEKLTEGVDYKVLPTTRHVQITEAGQKALANVSANIAHSWRSSRFREERVNQALSALHAYQLDRDYIVAEGQLVLTDPHTGRPTPDRRLPHGVHLLLELKEKCRPSAEHEFNDARRLDRQLAGRAARQGEPGSFQQLYCLDDAFLLDAMPSTVLRLARLCVGRGWNTCALVLIRAVQARTEYQHRTERIPTDR